MGRQRQRPVPHRVAVPGLRPGREPLEHHQAAQVQARNRHLLIWFGEATQSFWVAGPACLEEAHDLDTLLLKLWPHTNPPATRPRTSNTGTWIPALTCSAIYRATWAAPITQGGQSPSR